MRNKLETNFKINPATERKIPMGEEETEVESESKPIKFLTPLKVEE